jgi:hypothetical protein
MRRNGREWLDWEVHDGWAPLCEFLGKEVPWGVEFPSGNDPKEFTERRARLHGEKNAVGRAVTCGLLAVWWVQGLLL